MSSNEYIYNRQKHKFEEKKAEQSLTRKESVNADGKREVELTLSLQTETAQRVVRMYANEVKLLSKILDIVELGVKGSWLNGFLAALYVADIVNDEQYDALAEMLKIAIHQQHIKIENLRMKK